MPAPKQFKPGPQLESTQRTASPPVVSKGRYAIVTPTAPIVDDPAVVEVSVDDITVVVDPTTKYQHRSFHAYGEVADPEEEAAVDEPVAPAVVEHTPLGEWRSNSLLEGNRYRRTDTRLS